jgi:peptidyl-dipeptidase Dcp
MNLPKFERVALVAMMAMAGLSGCGDAPAPTQSTAPPASSAAPARINPLLNASSLQYQAPDFSAITDADYAPAFAEGMRVHAAEVRAIADSIDPPTFDNTLIALERSGALLTRVSKVFFNLTESNTNPAIQALQAELAPQLSAHQDSMLLDAKLFARIQAVHAGRAEVDAESQRLAQRYLDLFVRAGAELKPDAQARIRDINARLATLQTQFQNNLLKATTYDALVVTDRAELAGLDDAQVAQAAELARSRGLNGQWLLALTNTTRQPLLSALDNRAVRERLWKASAQRGMNSGETDNRPIAIELATLRGEKARLLKFPDWASYVLADQMAKTPQAVVTMLEGIVPQVRKNALAELSEIQKAIDADKGGFSAAPWDWEYYAERVRRARYDLDEAQVKPYFEFERVLNDGLFFTMNQTYGITLKARPDLPVYHPDVRAYEVFDSAGSSVGLFYGDWFAREGKRGGAWMDAFVDQSKLLEQKPVVVNVMNIGKAPNGKTLLSFDEVTTMFHEFGHALHGLFSDVTYPLLSGTNVPRDFVEFPSQFEEDWALDPKVLNNYAKHAETGEPIPAELLAKIRAAHGFNQGFDTMEYIAASLLDLRWHQLKADEVVIDADAFEARALKDAGVDLPQIPPRYRTGIFAHVFPGGYSAGYYAYLWSEVLAADAFAYTQSQGGLSRANGDAFRAAILSRGGTADPMALYVGFRGAEPSTDAFLKRRGLK